MTCHNDVAANVGSDSVKIAALQVDSPTSAHFPWVAAELAITPIG
jgi:hypothetical protein